MFSTCSELTPRAPIPDGGMAQIMQPCLQNLHLMKSFAKIVKEDNLDLASSLP